MSDDHGVLIEQARKEHTKLGGQTGFWCSVCRRSPWPCLSARLADALEAAKREQPDLNHIWACKLVDAERERDAAREQIGSLERELVSKREGFRMIYQCRLNSGNGGICRACWEYAGHHRADHTALTGGRTEGA